MKEYRVTLTGEERQALSQLTSKGKGAARKLLKPDEREGQGLARC